ncbi:MAG TPA: PhzF family phenazine biosynthesis protein [Candidatus Angelobacter sp.]|nr:PhzF family phenazine biosynthesis protein [Candidatus Angelobacter sp.]
MDAFTDRLFSGNPAAVCPLEEWLPAEVMQSIAAENNLSETAFFVSQPDGYELRWFTPVTEVDLCGHATLAAAFVIFNFLQPGATAACFRTKSGVLEVNREGDLIALDLPSFPAKPSVIPDGLVGALGQMPEDALEANAYVLVYQTERCVADLRPDFARLANLPRTVIVTAPGETADFVSRYFAPSRGVPEDPVTGSAHCRLIPYWAKRLGKTRLKARQLSKRGGDLLCEDRGERVRIAGRAVLYLEGAIRM